MSYSSLKLALIVQPITVRDEQLLEASGKILDHIVSSYSNRRVFADSRFIYLRFWEVSL